MEKINVRVSSDTIWLEILESYWHNGKSKTRTRTYFLNNVSGEELKNKLAKAIEQLENIKKGVCVHCGRNIYPKNRYFKLPDGAFLEKECLSEFMQTDNFKIITEPLKELIME